MPPFELTEQQARIRSSFLAGEDGAVEALAGTGKTTGLMVLAYAAAGQGRRGVYLAYNRALRNDQPVLTPDGYVPIGDIKVGDQAVGLDGRPHSVTAVHPQGIRPMNEVVFSDGTVVVADDEHIWVTQTMTYDAKPWSKTKWRQRTTEQLRETVNRKHRVPHLAGPVEFPERDLPLDPYLLGALIGDGSFANGEVTFTNLDQDLLDEVERLLPPGHVLNARDRKTYGVCPTQWGLGANQVMRTLRDLGLQGHRSLTKFIPHQYLHASASQRLALLQGLMDTDGCASRQQSFFITTSKQLVADVTFLTHSLGGVASVRSVPPGEQGRLAHWNEAYYVNVRIHPSLCPFRIPRKARAWRPRVTEAQTPRKIVAVRQVQAAEATCITVDADDHLFLTAGCIPTHNSMSDDAKRRMPQSVSCSTTHSIAYRWLGQQWGMDVLGERLRAPRIPTKDAARILGIAGATRINEQVVLAPARLISVTMETVRNYCYSADRVIKPRHVPKRAGMDDEASRAVLAKVVTPLAQRAWEEVTRPKGRLRLEHDTYLKLYCLSDPQVPCDFLLLDEAQDTNPCVAGLFLGQRNTHRVAVGDANQAIYGWRGSTDFLSTWAAQPGVQHLSLTTSFRFGPAVAEWANMWLTLLGSPLRVTGTDAVDSRVEPIAGMPDAVLCRSNARAVEEVISYHARGVKVHLAGRADDVKRLAEACIDLRTRGWTSHPELVAFTTWGMVQAYVEEAADGGDLTVAVKLIDTHGAEEIIDAIDQCVPAGQADVVVSTAHGAKGQEWAQVQIADDFKDPRDGDVPLPMQDEEMRLAYVAVTRARQVLDPAGLAFVVDRYRSHQAHAAAAARLVTIH